MVSLSNHGLLRFARNDDFDREGLRFGGCFRARIAPRNAPCPCGSGKKFKHCHGAVTAAEAG